MKLWGRALSIALGGLLVAGSAASIAAQQQTAPVRSAEEIYTSRCIHCHGARGWGTRVLARRVPDGQAQLTSREALPAALTRLVVRRGIGSMPQFTPTEITDAELAALADWLDKRR